jgi:hypothetical protein
MLKSEIIASVLKELRSNTRVERMRSSEDDEREQDVIAHLKAVLSEAPADADIRTCTDFIHLSAECCDTCHTYSFPFDMSPMVKLKCGEYAWICCAIGRAADAEILVRSPLPKQPAKHAEYKPFAELFGRKSRDQKDAK